MNRVIVVLLAASAMTLTSRVDTATAPAEVTRKVYISATDSKGAPVTDLAAADIAVKEGGKERPVASLQPASAPVHVTILVDDAGTGAFQAAVFTSSRRSMAAGSSPSACSTLRRSRIVDFTEDVDALKNALGRLGARGRLQPDGDQMPEAIAEAAKALQQRKVERPVILAMTIAGGQLHSVEPDNVLRILRASGAALSVLCVTGADLGQVMGDGPKQSGGRIEEVGTGPAIGPAAIRLADTLLNQYLLTYTLPDGVKMANRISVTTSRKGISLTSPSRIADK